MAGISKVTDRVEDPYHSLVTSITKEELDRVRPYNSKCSIHRVPTRLRRVNEAAYTPMVVSIGPMHHGKESLRIMQQHKGRFLLDFLQRPNVTLSKCVRIVKETEKRLRGCYEEAFDQLNSDEFVKIILLDAVFIVEVFLSRYHGVANAAKVLNEIQPDLLLLENQLPFLIIEKIWNLATPDKSATWFFYYYFNLTIGLNPPEKKKEELELGEEDENTYSVTSEHFVHLVSNLYMPLKPKRGKKVETLYIPSATEMHRAGIKFQAKSSNSFVDISFSKGILEIPKWKVDDRTESILRNLIAFEQCWSESDKTYLCYFSGLMTHLLHTPMDVDLLVDNGILENWLGDCQEVLSMINKSGSGVLLPIDNFYFADIFEDLNRHCSISWNKWMANLIHDHFSTPWAIVSLGGGVLLLILTFIQTVCSILSVRNGN